MGKPKLGSGKRFAAVAASAKKGGARNPRAVAAAAGIKKYGEESMEKMARGGKKRTAGKSSSKKCSTPSLKTPRGGMNYLTS